MTLTFNYLAGGTVVLNPADVVSYTEFGKGSKLSYLSDGEVHVAEVYEATSRIKSMLESCNG